MSSPATLGITLSALDLVALTLYGEARGLDLPGRIAVGLVIAHRVHHPKLKYGDGWAGVCLRPYAFSCWTPLNGGKANYDTVMALAEAIQAKQEPASPGVWPECAWVAEGVMDGVFVDTVKGANHYITRALFEKDPPPHLRGVLPVAAIGAHLFFRL